MIKILNFLLTINSYIDTASVVGASDITNSVEELELSIFDMAMKGGWIMIPIVLLAVIASYIFFERLFAISAANKSQRNFIDEVKNNIQDGNIDAAIYLSKSINSPIARMIEKGIKRIGRPLNDINAAIENVGKTEIYNLEKKLPTLATVAGAAPMIGFLGTVIGMIRAFYDMANNQAGNINVQLLSNGIYTAMVTTVAGLVVGILAYLAYNYLVARVEKVINNLELHSMEFIDLLNEPAK